MASDTTCKIAQEVQQLAEGLNKTLAGVQEKFSIIESIGDFVNNHVNKLGAAIGLYAEAFNRIPEVRDAVDELFDVEDNWNTFLKDVDRKMDHNKSDGLPQSSSTVGSVAPLHVPLIDVRTSSQAMFDAANTKTILITFGSQAGALQWLEETQATYPMLMDSDRKIYEAFGLRQSVAKVWSTTTMTYYAEQKCCGRSLYKMVKDDDPNQMGGDFIIGSNGEMTLVYCSKTPPDRPKIATLLSYL
ncbi:hypothetical protein TrispH2_005592 [Trichoplax sp. H2]|nr:hypothetical protein TrispH2_005592 [Trichoplax sp. H2]|eukprot:RDD42532.1 hypothetical protein TrispH2_005592 [Trichoplax sp. H2]